MSLAETDFAVIVSAVESATDQQLEKVVNPPNQTGSNPISLTLQMARAVALAWSNNWPSLNGSIEGNANSWRRAYKPLGNNKTLSKEQIRLVIDKVKEEYALRQLEPAMSVFPQVNGLEVTFNNTRVGGNPFVETEWIFGDGMSSSLAQPVHTYAEPGTYIVTCDILDGADRVGEANLEVTVF